MTRLYAVPLPRSCILARDCDRAWARDRVERGYFPRGSIWLPGTFGKRADLGDLYASDPDWRAPQPLGGTDSSSSASSPASPDELPW